MTKTNARRWQKSTTAAYVLTTDVGCYELARKGRKFELYVEGELYKTGSRNDLMWVAEMLDDDRRARIGNPLIEIL
jgi:hypothetical protein